MGIAPARFTGTVEKIGPIDVVALTLWVGAIAFSEWPQQRIGQLWPAMVTDLAWHGFGAETDEIVCRLLSRFPTCRAEQRMLSVVMPGRAIEPHTDSQPPQWVCRVHVPLTSNPQSRFIVGGFDHQLAPGFAYKVNTEAVHAVENNGATPRVHFMFDVGAS